MVVFTGAVPHDQMPPYYASCDVYVTASLSDTNSISMLEGMATGLPVLRRYDALNENVDQVRDGVNGYIFNSPEEMAAELRRIKNLSPEQLSILKASVIESVKRSGAEALANYTYNVYRKAMASASNPKEKYQNECIIPALFPQNRSDLCPGKSRGIFVPLPRTKLPVP